ncbi:hypothetical protein KFK09_028012 [Dendrobium nobile]|uniref:Uncharacterized protein n=1 Tax=Dendrobium nobile TaxID=94219 RepID=A0A8T3A0L7_DENNO|nr:hypothetical protein KFK09_028012 [Dendrobium nobile]
MFLLLSLEFYYLEDIFLSNYGYRRLLCLAICFTVDRMCNEVAISTYRSLSLLSPM